jgi:peroxiredoxin
MISVGQKIPSVTIKLATPEGGVEVDPSVLFAGKKVVMFSLPGAFTSTCSSKHMPGFVAKYSEIKKQGVDLVVCLSVNDHHVMRAWAEDQGATGKITMLADGEGLFTRALGLDVHMPGLGMRARRGLFTIEDGVVTSAEVEERGKFEVSSADACLANVKSHGSVAASAPVVPSPARRQPRRGRRPSRAGVRRARYHAGIRSQRG